MDDFSDHPKSLAEARANKAGDAALWTPRDALIAALRAIDKGELDPTSLIVIMATGPTGAGGGPTKMDYFNAMPNTFYGVGMLTAAAFDFNRGCVD